MKSEFICCICNTYIESNKTDPCDMNILINWDKQKDKQYNQTFYCHLKCFKNKLANEAKEHLLVDILVGADDLP